MKKVIITGATGMIGKGVLLECLEHDQIAQILVIGRSPIGLNHRKLTEVIHGNFTDFTGIKDKLRGFDACFYCLGISASGLSEQKYREITYDYTMALAETLHQLNANMTFNYVSGQGTDSTEKGRIMWARIKGKTENDLLKLGFKKAFMFRPGAIIPLKGIKSRTKSYQIMYDYFTWLLKIIKLMAPYSIVNTTQMGRAMINTLFMHYDKCILTPKDIINLSEGTNASNN
jgi:uncharacterized protein YbjT (DUF2867 family)